MTTIEESGLHATLTCITGKYAGKTFHVQNTATIGRDGDNSILLDEMVVSHQHARLYYDSSINSFVIEDLASRTGVMIDDEFVDERAPIHDGQTLTIANSFQFTFHAGVKQALGDPAGDNTELVEAQPQERPAANTERPQTPASSEVATAPEEQQSDKNIGRDATQSVQPAGQTQTFYLEGQNGANEQVTFSLNEGINLVGRDPSNSIHLHDASVSRHHAVIVLKNDHLLVRDLDSKNHTFVDGVQVEHESELQPGSAVLFGLMAFVVRRKQ